MLRDEGPFQSNHPESDKTAAHAVRRISAKRTQASFARARSALGSVTRLSVEKSPSIFPVVYREAYFATRCGCMDAPGLKKPVRQKAAGFGETNPRVTQVEPQCRLGPNEPNQIWRSQRAGGTSLSRDSARMVISAIVEGLCHNHFRHFPQTKPISANEANVEKPNEPMLQDEQHAPLRSGARTRLLCACSGAAGSAFCQPVQIDDEGSL
jgi:hypothetical protein